VMVLLRMVFQPGPNEFIELRFGIWLALISSAVIAYGGWEAMKEEGTSFEDARDQLRDRAHTGTRGEAAVERPVGPSSPAAPPAEPGTQPSPEGESSQPPPRPAP
jgi:hypothetical protein